MDADRFGIGLCRLRVGYVPGARFLDVTASAGVQALVNLHEDLEDETRVWRTQCRRIDVRSYRCTQWPSPTEPTNPQPPKHTKRLLDSDDPDLVCTCSSRTPWRR